MIAVTEIDNFSLPPSGAFLVLFIVGLSLFFLYFFAFGLFFADRKLSKAKANIAVAVGAFMLMGSFALAITSSVLVTNEERAVKAEVSPNGKTQPIEILEDREQDSKVARNTR